MISGIENVWSRSAGSQKPRVSHPRLRMAQANQGKQQPFLVKRRAVDFAQFLLVDAERRYDDRCMAEVAALYGLPQLRQARLERSKGFDVLFFSA